MPLDSPLDFSASIADMTAANVVEVARLAIAGAVLTSAGRDSDLVVFTSGIGGGIKDLAPAKEFINLLMSSAALPPCYLVRCLYLGTSRTSADLRLESAKWAKADLIRSLSPIAI